MLITVTGVAIALYFGLKYSKRAVEGKFSGEIKIIDRKVIDQGSTLVLIQLRNKEYLLAMGAKGLHIVDSIESKKTLENQDFKREEEC